MRIKTLILHCAELDAQKAFYRAVLGVEFIEEMTHYFTVQIGWTRLTFMQGDEKNDPRHHYCFLIPSNQLQAAMDWFQERLQLIQIEEDRFIQHFDTWNADSFYFYDGVGNVAECIVRYGLENSSDAPFPKDSFLCVNEIGMPVLDIKTRDRKLSEVQGSPFWKGDYEYFGTHGSEEGLFLLPNLTRKKVWFPTELPIERAGFAAITEVNGQKFWINNNLGENIIISKLPVNN